MPDSTRELLALSQVLGEMLANGIIERDNEVHVYREKDRVFMVEVKVLDVTNAKEMT